MIDNTDLILPFLSFPDSDTYYLVQVLDRSVKKNMKKWTGILVKNSIEKELETAKKVALIYKARVYISLIPRSLKKFTIETCAAYLERIRTETWIAANYRIPSSVALKQETRKGKGIWLLDVDDPGQKEDVEGWAEKEGVNILAEIPSFHGYHFIVSPFNLKDYPELEIELETGPKIAIKQDCNTILFGVS